MINRIYWTSYGKLVVVFNYQAYEFDDEDEAEDWFGKKLIDEYYRNQ